MRPYSFCSILLGVIILFSCSGRQVRQAGEGGDTLRFKYATRLTVVRYAGYSVATIANPWKEGKTLHTYVLVPRNAKLPADLPEGTVVRTPLQRSIIFTSVHCALVQMLGRQQSVAGVADLKYIKVPFVQEGCRTGRIVDCGEGMSPVIEKIIDQRPDAILLSPFENSGGYGKLEEIDIPLIECAEYMEPSPLARAEWMRFYGMLYGAEQCADSLFAVVDSSYQAWKQTARLSKVVRSALVDKQTGSVWYVPGGRSTIGRMIADAYGRYPWATDEHSGSVSLPFESVLERAGDADVWLFRYNSDHDMTMGELLKEHHGYQQLRAVHEQQVYGCDVQRSLFYEETPFRPDYLLGDFIQILHPDIPNLPPLRYYKQVK